MNAGLLVDMPHLAETGAKSIGLFRTELQFMLAARFPRPGAQQQLYRAILDAAGDRQVTFRTLDIGGDKLLPYMKGFEEENPALGWRALRIGLDRPALLRMQFRAFIRAAAGATSRSWRRWFRPSTNTESRARCSITNSTGARAAAMNRRARPVSG